VRSRRARAAAVTLAAVLTLTAACSFGPPDPDQQGAPPNLPKPSAVLPSGENPNGGSQEVAVSVLAKNLEVPTSIAFLPDGAALVTERDTGRILQVGPESGDDGLKVTEVQRLAEVQTSGDGGLLDGQGQPDRQAPAQGQAPADPDRHPAVRDGERWRAGLRSGRFPVRRDR
jgi:glucose/arabinose dehydrogenase